MLTATSVGTCSSVVSVPSAMLQRVDAKFIRWQLNEKCVSNRLSSLQFTNLCGVEKARHYYQCSELLE